MLANSTGKEARRRRGIKRKLHQLLSSGTLRSHPPSPSLHVRRSSTKFNLLAPFAPSRNRSPLPRFLDDLRSRAGQTAVWRNETRKRRCAMRINITGLQLRKFEISIRCQETFASPSAEYRTRRGKSSDRVVLRRVQLKGMSVSMNGKEGH